LGIEPSYAIVMFCSWQSTTRLVQAQIINSHSYFSEVPIVKRLAIKLSGSVRSVPGFSFS
jgi:hypothetical protein